ncbi:sulfotransferase [Streptomyces sp. N2-109]|uniref:Sulfotransferase n=1 Tax=Streptomyces gossypii TaxID=2883101 RepID=A0ABT2K055_9ACTN|nr:sulfotransferase [Streptomyces gossypii]MCT2593556.1 sulfotransferase [Streptomyces gossypii]
MPERPLTFIVGTGRSGSSALSRIINLHPDVLSLNEMFASLGDGALPRAPFTGEEFWRILAEPNAFFDRMTRSGVPLPEFLYIRDPGRYSAETGIPALSLMVLPHLSEDPDGLLDAVEPEIRALPRRPAAQQYESLFEVLSARCGGGRAVIERSGYSLGAIPRLRAAFPHARFVHLFRDGPDCAVSMSRHVGYRSIALLREIFGRSGVRSLSELTPEREAELPPDLTWLLRHRFDADLLLERPMPVTGFGALWSQIVSEGVARLAEIPAGQRTTLSYEDLLDTPREELTRLAAFAGFAPHPDWLARGAATLDGARRGAALRLPAEELAELRERCAPGVRALAEAGGHG